ncbi:MarR family transcriptional regulator [Solimonas sp. K1W22B-7]|uniref:MarR family winged helix-turn-helix transcriptional regulator n=1 Tax=Solimonas sp. K1W22B-7 TaxID=2303331 RepID=UPI000E335972|nr:MarR family winged helix-turn-helix transcriptional regulator [Solimonas sp. K1W22B-7]AXQ27596.1 MarR family transcriptional regulator [Solimonas sp. K1W22B-7]
MPRPTPPPTPQDYQALSEFRYQLRRFLRFSEDAAQAEGITALQYQLMLHVQGNPERDWALVGELAERLQMQQHGTVALVTRCETAGLVRRTRARDDRRQVQVRLTSKGKACLRRLVALHRAELQSLSGVFRVTHIPAFNDRL